MDALGDNVRTLAGKLQATSDKLTKAGIADSFASFLTEATASVADLESKFKNLKDKVAAIAKRFCEKPDFKIEDFIATLNEFSKQFVLAIDQNNAKRIAAKKAEDRKKALEEVKEKQAVNTEGCVVDALLAKVQKGLFTAPAASSTAQAKKEDKFAAAMAAAAASSTTAGSKSSPAPTPARQPSAQ